MYVNYNPQFPVLRRTGVPARGKFARGFGASLTGGAATADQIATSGAATTTAIALTLAGVGGPIGAAAGGLIALAGEIASLFGGCGQTCVEATNIANQLGDTLTSNLQQYLAAPTHYQSLQSAALNNFTTAWNALVQACSNPSLGSAGQRCISDRQQGACTIHSSTPGGWQQQNGTWTYVYPGAAVSSGGSCWNYWIAFHDPIANDPTVVPDPGSSATSSVTSAISNLSQTTIFGIPITLLAIPAGLLLVAFLIGGED